MIRNYLKTAWRNLVKNKVSSLINVVSLSLGMAVTILIALWIFNELSFDKYYKNYRSIARVMQNQTLNGETASLKAMPIPLAIQLRHQYGNFFKEVVLSSWTNPHQLKITNKILSAQGNFMESGASEMLSLKMINGVRKGLNNPNTIMLSETISKELFNGEDPIGKTLKLDEHNLTITGIYQDFPSNTSFNNLHFIASWDIYANTNEIKQACADWNQNSFQIFVQLSDNQDFYLINNKIKSLKFNNEDAEVKKLNPQIFLFPMNKWHLYADFKNGFNVGGDIKYIWLFGITGIFVLLLACINFINLSTARSQKRAKEVGIRKSIGSSQKQLIIQFLGESILLSIIAFSSSIIILQLLLPIFNNLVGKQIVVFWGNPTFWLIVFGFVIICGLMAGLYPAFYLSSFNPVKVLKGTNSGGKWSSLPRKILVVFQFSFSIIMMIGTVIVFMQIQYAKNRPIGYTQNRLVMIRPYSEDIHKQFTAFRNDLLESRMVSEVAESGNQITKGSRTNGGLSWQGKDPNMKDEFATFAITPSFGKTIGWHISAGKDFENNGDLNKIVINESAIKYMGLIHPIGQIVRWDGKDYTITGVSKDIIVESPYEPIKPTIFFVKMEVGLINLKINSNVSAAQAIQTIGMIYKKYAPGQPFDYQFADEEYDKKFLSESRIGSLASSFAILAIFISCIGLFAMTSYMVEIRTKEISVRKVLGATVLGLWILLSEEFIKLILIALLIALPVSWYFLNSWLQHYTFHTELSLWVYITTAIGTILISILTTSYQSVKAAIANPVKSLRSE